MHPCEEKKMWRGKSEEEKDDDEGKSSRWLSIEMSMTPTFMAACSTLSALTLLAPWTSASSEYDPWRTPSHHDHHDESIFDPNFPWPYPNIEYGRHVYDPTAIYPRPTNWPFREFGKDEDLTYFTRAEYEVYGQKYWTPRDRDAYHQASVYPFDYVVEKWLPHEERLVRFLNYTMPPPWDEKFAYNIFFVELRVAEQEQVLTLVQERLYRNYGSPCTLPFRDIDFKQKLEREVMRHVMYGYDATKTKRKSYTTRDIDDMDIENLYHIIDRASRMHVFRLSDRDRKRRSRYNDRPTNSQPEARK